MFDEPGVVGTFAALFIVADDFQMRYKVRNIIILIGGMFNIFNCILQYDYDCYRN